MSKSITLRAALAAFMGDGESAVSIVAAAVAVAVATLAQHGTRAPLDDASTYCATAKGTAKRFAALRAGWSAVEGTMRGIAPGKMDGPAASALGESAADAFTLAAGAILGAAIVKGKADPLKAGARALATLKALSAAQLRKVFAGEHGADVLAAIAAMQAASVAPVKADTVAARVIKAAQAPMVAA